MDIQSFLATRTSELTSQIMEAEKEYRAAARDARAKRETLNALYARRTELYMLRQSVSQCDLDGDEAVDDDIRLKASAVIRGHLAHTESGYTLAQLDSLMHEFKRTTISATLYNMKKRGEVVHCENTGRYRLSSSVGFVRRSQPTLLKPK